MTGSKRFKWLALVALALLTSAQGCSDSEGNAKPSTAEEDAGSDTGGPLFQPTDVQMANDGAAAAPDAGGSAIDTATEDSGSSDSAGSKASFEQPCDANDDCASGRCVFTANGSRCTKECTGDCGSAQWACRKVGTASVCVWRWGHLCEPCKTNNDCFSNGQNAAKCVSLGDKGAFCGAACASDTQCPEGYKCANGTDVEGKDAQQCVPKDDACACSAWASDKQLSTTCLTTSTYGTCTGAATCAKAGAAPACDAPTPMTEACDFKDNDCDGATDEQTCEDAEFCTTSTCEGAAGCKTVNKVGNCDADGSACTTGDSCVDGKCKAGEVLQCDDKNPCTQDVCEASKGCVFTFVASACNADDNPCTLNDTCKDGKCVAGAPKGCESGQPCVTGACVFSTGKCKFTDRDGLNCDDGDACSTGGKCAKEICKSQPLLCDDNKPCTIDACDKTKGCTHVSKQGPCEDGNACTKADSCQDGLCVGLPVSVSNDCDDKNPCTSDGCNPASKAKLGCTHKPTEGACDDGSACTVKDSCVAGKCVGGTNECKCKTNAECDDKNPCTDDACVTLAGKQVCKQTPIEKLACDADGSVCTQDDICLNGQCTKGTAKSCDDANSCTADACDPKTGCKNSAITGSCDDGNPCTAGDVCGSVGGSKTGCKAGKLKDCDDSVECTVDSCDPKSGGCLNVSAVGKSVPCYSGDAKKVGVGVCKKGTQTCKPDGTLTKCDGEVLPQNADSCGNTLDDDCDGSTDEGCAPVGFEGRVVSGSVRGVAGKLQASAVAGGSLTCGQHSAGKWSVGLGLYEWLGAL